MKNQVFNYNLKDSQATVVKPLSVKKFDIERYNEYEARVEEKCKKFWNSNSGVLVYRRMRVAEVFSTDCGDIKKSLEWQLGGLNKSMEYKTDIPNFIEPWYGIGTVASSFGFDYYWADGQAPAVNGKFNSTAEALNIDVTPVKNTKIGQHTIKMLEYFIHETKGKIPLSYCDVQSPLNVAGNIIDINNFLTGFYMDTSGIIKILDIIADLIIEFTNEQTKLLGDVLVKPGHGFASCRKFEGFGMSDDNMVMLPDDLYREMVLPSFIKVGEALGGPVLHSCGNWLDKIDIIKKIPNLKMVDAAFSSQTDPDPNPPEYFAEGFCNTGIVLNARIVGNMEVIEEKVKKLWKPGMKLIVVTYCQSFEEQEKAYNLIHSICNS